MAIPSEGSAERWGPLWGARAHDWAANEDQQLPTYLEAIRRVGITAGQHVLDIGCGSGAFLEAAARQGASAYGLDASEALIELARARIPDADLRVGDMQLLPWGDAEFDVVTGFNSFFFAADMVAALREASRVAKPSAPVVVQVWGRPEHCALTAMKQAVAPFLPPPPPDAPPSPRLWEPGVLECIAVEANLRPQAAFDVSWAFAFPDEDALARAMLSAGGIVELAGASRQEDVRAAIVAALAQCRTPDGAYRIENEWHVVVASAPHG